MTTEINEYTQKIEEANANLEELRESTVGRHLCKADASRTMKRISRERKRKLQRRSWRSRSERMVCTRLKRLTRIKWVSIGLG